jgi:hypothetical protein
MGTNWRRGHDDEGSGGSEERCLQHGFVSLERSVSSETRRAMIGSSS